MKSFLNYGVGNGKLGFSAMAPGSVFNDYVNSLVQSGKRDAGHFVGGVEHHTMFVTWEIADATNDDGSIYRVVKNIHPDVILTNIKFWNDALTGFTSASLGLYLPLAEGGAIIGSGNQFMSAVDISSAHVHNANLDGMSACDVASLGNKIFEWAGHTILTKKRGYDLALTATTGGSGAGTISIQIDFMV